LCLIGHSSYTTFFPQQLPGPAQPEASPGEKPQQAVSPEPGKLFFANPDMEEWADKHFFMFLLPQKLHWG